MAGLQRVLNKLDVLNISTYDITKTRRRELRNRINTNDSEREGLSLVAGKGKESEANKWCRKLFITSKNSYGMTRKDNPPCHVEKRRLEHEGIQRGCFLM